ncbi:unnamed protein product [Didymodactylos carnosus]|uniref:RRM domain-containing protein n=1 Tax=Didymodactylos carnosus TaxID=1234261 RepID=A0A814T7V7_9BILA|nr:unnamed protein product [Didymodactylos carnosus]CAF1157158.1 unnamed protein product [Didymodactylos carnosus]CAF3668654.1 unnamed protein product [Didymodactylos carnosus]CAF3920611.1 unnamed protein product [Didymodactylos carnosus]
MTPLDKVVNEILPTVLRSSVISSISLKMSSPIMFKRERDSRERRFTRNNRSRSRSPISSSVNIKSASKSPSSIQQPSSTIIKRKSEDPSDRDESTQVTTTPQKHRHRHHHKSSKSEQARLAAAEQARLAAAAQAAESDDEGSASLSESHGEMSESEISEQELSSSENESNDEEGMIEGGHSSSRKRQRTSNNQSNNQQKQQQNSGQQQTGKGTQLIVNYLPSSLRESDFYQLFARMGSVKLCKLVTDRSTGHSMGYGFIEYVTPEDAIKAIDKYNGYRIEHKTLKVSYAQPKSGGTSSGGSSQSDGPVIKNANLYLKDLPDEYDEQTLERMFSKYGDIVKTKILRDPRTRISRGVGFVLMASKQYAERAVEALDGYVPSGSRIPISVKFADPKKMNAGRTTSLPIPSYPGGLPSQLAPAMLDPYYHRAMLSPSPPYHRSAAPYETSSRSRGGTSSLRLPRSYSASRYSPSVLAAAVSDFTGGGRSGGASNGALAAAAQLIASGYQEAIDPNGFVIYAFGLPHECDENDLEDLFRCKNDFDVYRVFIVRNYTTGESKGYAFITMRNYDEACYAIEKLDGSTFKGRTLQVRFKR